MGDIVDTIILVLNYLSSQPYGSGFTDTDKLSYNTKNLISSINICTEINQTLTHVCKSSTLFSKAFV